MADISVIIPVYNEENAMGRCLASLLRQTLKPKEVIVVDDGSSDKTSKVLSQFRIQNSEFRIFRQEHKGAGAARNLGASKARGEILVFGDADMRFSGTFLEDLTAPIREGKSKGTFSKQEYIANWDNIWARFWNYWRGLYEPIAVPKDFPHMSPVFRAILRTAFEKVGGFDEQRGYNDDWSLSEKLGIKATETSARFYHENPSSLGDVFRQARWSAKRSYRYGWIGTVASLFRAFPLWAAPWAWYRTWKRRDNLAESLWALTFFSATFFFVVQIGVSLGMIEFVLFKTPQK